MCNHIVHIFHMNHFGICEEKIVLGTFLVLKYKRIAYRKIKRGETDRSRHHVRTAQHPLRAQPKCKPSRLLAYSVCPVPTASILSHRRRRRPPGLPKSPRRSRQPSAKSATVFSSFDPVAVMPRLLFLFL
jgi:hypothetical protein